MFEGTDLSMAYGGYNEPSMSQLVYSPELPPPAVQSTNQAPPPPQPPRKQSKVMVSSQQPNDVAYQPPEAMYTQQPPHNQGHPIQVQQDSFFDRLSMRRYEVLKVFVFSLIILFAISMDRFFSHYLAQYITESVLTKNQEILIRVSYPVAIILVIWFIKAM
jgi:hypothetical protein